MPPLAVEPRRRGGKSFLAKSIDGDDIIAVSRTAYDDGFGGAHRAHDANYMTFHRIRNFRRFLASEENLQ